MLNFHNKVMTLPFSSFFFLSKDIDMLLFRVIDFTSNCLVINQELSFRRWGWLPNFTQNSSQTLVLFINFCSKGIILEDLSFFFFCQTPIYIQTLPIKYFLNISLTVGIFQVKILTYRQTAIAVSLDYWGSCNYVHKPLAHLFLLRASVFLHDSSFL